MGCWLEKWGDVGEELFIGTRVMDRKILWSSWLIYVATTCIFILVHQLLTQARARDFIMTQTHQIIKYTGSTWFLVSPWQSSKHIIIKKRIKGGISPGRRRSPTVIHLNPGSNSHIHGKLLRTPTGFGVNHINLPKSYSSAAMVIALLLGAWLNS